ncbi:Roquin-2 [Nymphon striatum]|nr:Roquin-2 [Nymphon striatum]
MPVQPPVWSDYLICAVCRNDFDANSKRPISLVCGHTMCRSCLRGLHFKPCPFDTAVIKTNINGLPENFALLLLITDKITADHAKRALDYSSLNLSEDHLKLFQHCLSHIEELACFLKPHVVVTGDVSSAVLSRPMQRKLVALITSQLVEEEGRCRALRAARSLGERVVTELILQHQNSQQLCANLWAAVRARGCQFLGPAMQEEVLKLILLALEDGESFSRKVLVMFVVQRLEARYSQASKTSIGHVVQLLYRASCFKVFKRDGESSLMQLKEEFRSYESLRREHDAQIVQIATESGLRIAPDQWSSLLYADTSHKSHMQSIMDKLQTPQSFAQSVQELVIALQRTGDPGHLQCLQSHFELLADIDIASEEMNATWKDTEQDLSAVKLVVNGMVNFIKSHGNRKIHDHCQTFNNKYKTNMCRDFTQRNICPRGINCTFAHSQDEMERLLYSCIVLETRKEEMLDGMEMQILQFFTKNRHRMHVIYQHLCSNQAISKGNVQEGLLSRLPLLPLCKITPVDDNLDIMNQRLSSLNLNRLASNANTSTSNVSPVKSEGIMNSINNYNMGGRCEVTHVHPQHPVPHRHHHQLPITQTDFYSDLESNLPPVVTNATTLSWATPGRIVAKRVLCKYENDVRDLRAFWTAGSGQILSSGLTTAEPHLNQPQPGGSSIVPSVISCCKWTIKNNLNSFASSSSLPLHHPMYNLFLHKLLVCFQHQPLFIQTSSKLRFLAAGPGQPVALAPAPPGTPVEETISVISPTCYDPNTGYQLVARKWIQRSILPLFIFTKQMSNPVNKLAFLEKRKMDLLTHLEKDELSFLNRPQDFVLNGKDNSAVSEHMISSSTSDILAKSVYSPWTSASFMPQFKINSDNSQSSRSITRNNDSLTTTIADAPNATTTDTTATTNTEMTTLSQDDKNYKSSSRKQLCREGFDHPSIQEDEEFIPFDPPLVSRFGPICRMARSLIAGNTAPIQVNATTLSSGVISITPAPTASPLPSAWYLQPTKRQPQSASQGQPHQLHQHDNPTLIPHQQLPTLETFYKQQQQQLSTFHHKSNTVPVIIQERVPPPRAGMNCEENMKLELLQLDKQINIIKQQQQIYSNNNNSKEKKLPNDKSKRICAVAAVTPSLCSARHHQANSHVS